MIGVPFARMQESAAAILGPDLYREAFTILGPPASPAEADETFISSAVSRKARPRMETDYCVGCYAPDCECNLGDNWCAWGQTCFGDNCKSDSWGCGTMWQKVCNGMCH